MSAGGSEAPAGPHGLARKLHVPSIKVFRRHLIVRPGGPGERAVIDASKIHSRETYLD